LNRLESRQPPADGGGRGALDLAHVAFPGDHPPVVYLAQLLAASDGECRHETPHVEPVRPAGARALLLGEPDFFLGNVGQAFHHRGPLRLVVVS
jgi:hypothetical protein